MNKVFIIGLPRTGTTSICAALLEHDFKVAHTALTKQSFELADVIADTPCFADYRQLDQLFPGSLFVYCQRDIITWLPSIQMLLDKMLKFKQAGGHFNPVIERCFNEAFQLWTCKNPLDTKHLTLCYQQHQQAILTYFKGRNDLLSIDVSETDSLKTLLQFLGKPAPKNIEFPQLNANRMITAWRDIKHPNKINSNAIGPERRKFFDYA
jgi:hypothetical protein